MITRQDLKQLTHHQTLDGKLVGYATSGIAGIMLLLAAVNIHLAGSMAARAGTDLLGLYQSWAGGVNIYATYSGAYLSGLQHLNNSLLDLSIALLLAITSSCIGNKAA